MKLKVLVITFNIVLFVLLFTVFLFPFFFPKGAYTRHVWIINIVFGICFLIMIAAVNIVFFKNKRLTDFIENEDWNAMSLYLEQKIFSKKRFDFKDVRLFTEALMLSRNFSLFCRLEAFLDERNAKYLQRLSVRFAAVKILLEDYKGLYAFAMRFNKSKDYTGEWMRFCSAFACQMNKKYTEAFKGFMDVLQSSKDDLIKVLSAYFVFCVLKGFSEMSAQELSAKETGIKAALLKRYSSEKWQVYTEKQKKRLHIMMFTKVIDDAGAWLFG